MIWLTSNSVVVVSNIDFFYFGNLNQMLDLNSNELNHLIHQLNICIFIISSMYIHKQVDSNVDGQLKRLSTYMV